MIAEIKDHLRALAEKENFTILLAIESGSRAWGFPSPDSDYDVRVIFAQKQDWYLSIDNKRDTIDYFHGELLDINGWDIRKTLRLLRKSNATPFEWAQSPIVYHEEVGFREGLLALANSFFQARHSVNHYMGIAKNSFKALDATSSKIKLKKLFYVLRPLLAATWIVEKKAIPPMDMPPLLENLKSGDFKSRIHHLMAIKEGVSEDYVHELDRELIQFIEAAFQYVEEHLPLADRKLPSSAILDDFYRSQLQKHGA